MAGERPQLPREGRKGIASSVSVARVSGICGGMAVKALPYGRCVIEEAWS